MLHVAPGGVAVPLSLLALTLALQLVGAPARAWLRYDRSGILHGEIWRLLTAHLVHLNWPHLLLNLAGLVLVWALFGRCWSTRLWLYALAVCGVGIGLGLLALSPQVHGYVGLSGVLHGLFVVGVLVDEGFRRAERALLLGLLFLKLGWEQLHGPTPGVEQMIGAAVVTQAHLYGALCGLAVGLVERRLSAPAAASCG